MDIQNTVTRVKGEYKDYLRRTHPSWADSTVSTHVSDAFYLYQNTIVLSFWKCFADDDSMEAARQDLFDYLTNEVMSDRAWERAKGYYKDLTMLREFIDSRGGVRRYIGYEYDCEITIYQYAKRVYDGELEAKDAVNALRAEVLCFGERSLSYFISLLALMIEGKKYTWKANTELTTYFITHIGQDYGQEKMTNALRATQGNIKYYYGQTGNKSTSIRRSCRRIAEQNGIDISFGDDIFDGIIPKESGDTVLTDNHTEVDVDSLDSKAAVIRWYMPVIDALLSFGGESTRIDATKKVIAICEVTEEELSKTIKSGDSAVERSIEFARNDLCYEGFIDNSKRGVWSLTELGRKIIISDELAPKIRAKWVKIKSIERSNRNKMENRPIPEIDLTPYYRYRLGIEHAEIYSKEQFLQEVYITESKYDQMVSVLRNKKNIILQGAPGVGKTFASKRLAYSIMGEKDTSRVQMVQFHQSYSYEDFIMGFRPTETGFTLKKGVFYQFCQKARKDNERPYFFIIDEINRGNLSKIFGDLFMLIESDKRGVELQLLYADEQFSIPSNVHIIGMMNTADRGLAMLDYALRRRFAFFEMPPAFASAGFQAYQAKINNVRFNRLVEAVERLNEEITEDDSLGKGFRVGHSYFCTRLTVNDEWLRSVVEFELIPLLSEYWFDEPAKVETWSGILREAVE